MLQLRYVNAKGLSMNALQIRDDKGILRATITAIDGLHGVDLEMSSSTSPYFDGDQVDHMRANPRSITLTYHLHTPIAESLNYFNTIVKSKQILTISSFWKYAFLGAQAQSLSATFSVLKPCEILTFSNIEATSARLASRFGEI